MEMLETLWCSRKLTIGINELVPFVFSRVFFVAETPTIKVRDYIKLVVCELLLQPFYGPLSGTTQVSW